MFIASTGTGGGALHQVDVRRHRCAGKSPLINFLILFFNIFSRTTSGFGLFPEGPCGDFHGLSGTPLNRLRQIEARVCEGVRADLARRGHSIAVVPAYAKHSLATL